MPGTTRMRISMKWAGAPPACGKFYYGEVEDYTVQIEGQEATGARSASALTGFMWSIPAAAETVPAIPSMIMTAWT